MTTPTKTNSDHFGYLTVLEDAGAGYLGGYLVVNERGRPVEFHCCEPVVPTRAEEILFGPTLRPHLFAERIGAALLARASSVVSAILVNQVDAWSVADETTVPVVLVQPPRDGESSNETDRINFGPIAPEWRGKLEQQLACVTRYVDISEPFSRIEQAIREATDSGNQREAPHDQAA